MFDCFLSANIGSNLLVYFCLYPICFRMESTYRMWTRNRRNGFGLEASDELSRELQTALGTAKWQVCFFPQL